MKMALVGNVNCASGGTQLTPEQVEAFLCQVQAVMLEFRVIKLDVAFDPYALNSSSPMASMVQD